MTKEELMRKAIELSVRNVAEGGGPFGSVIARNGEIIATGTNRVTPDHDPTAHAEVSAIRAACRKLGTFDLSGCEIYTSCDRANLAPCVWEPSIGRIWTACITETTNTMPPVSDSMTHSSTKNWN